MSILRIFETSKRSLLSHQTAINTTANNVANVYTEGYSRRKIDLSKLSLGFGNISEDSVTRIKNKFLDNQIWYESQALGKHEMQENLLNQVENIFGEPSESGLANIITDFWDSWSNLSNDPESNSARSLVIDKGIILTNTFNRLDNNLKELQIQSGQEIQQNINEINQLIKQLGSLNKQIDMHRTSDLFDQRDILLTELSQKIEINVTENESGTVEVLSGGHMIISEDYINELKLEINQNNDNRLSCDIKTTKGDNLLKISSGELGGLLEFYNVNISSYIQSIDRLASELIENVNFIHSNGFNGSDRTGINFFNNTADSAGEMAVNKQIIGNPHLITTSSATDLEGDGSTARSLFDLQFETVMNENTIMDYYSSIISDVGSKASEAKFVRQNQEKIVQQLNINKASLTGVSLDEEMTQLIQYEQAYEAAARMISTIDELMQTVLDM